MPSMRFDPDLMVAEQLKEVVSKVAVLEPAYITLVTGEKLVVAADAVLVITQGALSWSEGRRAYFVPISSIASMTV